MKLVTPSYYDSFHCLASACPDTCCQEWDIQVDPKTASYYQNLPGALGDQIRSSLHVEDGETLISLRDNHCPMQTAQGLCSIQANLGEQALCQVCRDFPRIRHDYGDFVELGLELSCPEAARILLTTPYAPPAALEVPDDGDPDYDEEAMEVLLTARDNALKLLSDETRPAGETLSLFFLYSCQVQQLLDGEAPAAFDADASLQTAYSMKSQGNLSDVCHFFSSLEVLTEEWASLLKEAQKAAIPPICRNLAGYLTGRYWLQAVSDYDLYCRVKFILISCILISSLPGDFIWNAHLFSKEIENDIDNVDAILDAAYGDPIFTDDKLLGFLL